MTTATAWHMQTAANRHRPSVVRAQFSAPAAMETPSARVKSENCRNRSQQRMMTTNLIQTVDRWLCANTHRSVSMTIMWYNAKMTVPANSPSISPDALRPNTANSSKCQRNRPDIGCSRAFSNCPASAKKRLAALLCHRRRRHRCSAWHRVHRRPRNTTTVRPNDVILALDRTDYSSQCPTNRLGESHSLFSHCSHCSIFRARLW